MSLTNWFSISEQQKSYGVAVGPYLGGSRCVAPPFEIEVNYPLKKQEIIETLKILITEFDCLKLFFNENIFSEKLRQSYQDEITDERLDQIIFEHEISQENTCYMYKCINSLYKTAIPIKKWPLFRVFNIIIDNKKSILVIYIHHMIVDGVTQYHICNKLNNIFSGKSNNSKEYKQVETKNTFEAKTFSSIDNPKNKLPYKLPENISSFDLLTDQQDIGKIYTRLMNAKLTILTKKTAQACSVSSFSIWMVAFALTLNKLNNSKIIPIILPYRSSKFSLNKAEGLLSDLGIIYINTTKSLKKSYESVRNTYKHIRDLKIKGTSFYEEFIKNNINNHNILDFPFSSCMFNSFMINKKPHKIDKEHNSGRGYKYQIHTIMHKLSNSDDVYITNYYRKTVFSENEIKLFVNEFEKQIEVLLKNLLKSGNNIKKHTLEN